MHDGVNPDRSFICIYIYIFFLKWEMQMCYFVVSVCLGAFMLNKCDFRVSPRTSAY